jgi:type IV pilus biogenesis protein CpaD/CtpE
MVDMNEIIVASKDKDLKAVFNGLLVDLFNELGGMEKDAIDVMVPMLNEAGIANSRASVVGKLSIMGVKKIVKPKTVIKAKKNEGPTKKELVLTFISLLRVNIYEVDSLNNMRKGDIKNLIKAVEELMVEV